MKRSKRKYLDIRTLSCSYPYNTTFYLPMLNSDGDCGLIFVKKPFLPPEYLYCHIFFGSRKDHTTQQLKFIQSLGSTKFGCCSTRMKKNDVSLYFQYTSEVMLKQLLSSIDEQNIKYTLDFPQETS